MGEYIEDRGRRDRRRMRKAVGKGKVRILENSRFLFRCGTLSAAAGQKEQPFLLSAPSFRVWRTINQLVLMQQGPTGGLAGEVPRTVTSHMLRNLLPLAEILMADGTCVSEYMCMYTCRRERKYILLSLFHLSHTLLWILIFSYVYTKKSCFSHYLQKCWKTWFWQEALIVRHCWSLSRLPDHLWRGIKSQKLFNQVFKLSYCLTSWAQLALLLL